MSIFKIAWRSVQQRGLASALTTFSMALGVMLVVIVLSVHGVVTESFRSNATLGYNLVVGPAKGSGLQLTMSAVYYLSQPAENLPYGFYLEFLPADQRQRDLRNSISYEANQSQQQLSPLLAAAPAVAAAPPAALLNWLAPASALQTASENAFFLFWPGRSPEMIEMDRDGQYAQFTSLVIPVLLGDYFREYRVVGTTPAMFDDRVYDEERGLKFEFAEGRNFREHSEEHGYFEAVVGARVAEEANVKLGDVISPTHGDPEGEGHGTGFHVVGLLNHTGTPNDRAVFVNMEGFFLMEGHAKPIEEEEPTEEEEWDLEEILADESLGEVADEPEEPAPALASRSTLRTLPLEQREVTSLLVRTVNPLVAPGLENRINEGLVGQAVPPIREIFNLLNMIVGPIQLALLGLTVMICIVSGVSILVSIYNSMNDRKRDIAIMRALGAGRGTVQMVVLLESVILSLAGGVLGWFMGHTVNGLMGPVIEDRTGVRVRFWDLAPSIDLLDLLGIKARIGWLEELPISIEILLIPALIMLAIVVGFLPSLAAYRTDVAKTLAS